jgi:drug/metabolite transporter (DMT)-like permease
MEWYQYLAGFLAGVFFANAVPHFVHGISGDKFPTPFAKPPGRGLSSPTTNVLWALLNIIIACSLFRISKFHHDKPLELIILFAGVVVMSTLLSNRFQHKAKE